MTGQTRTGFNPRMGLLLVGNPTVLSRMYKDKPKFMHLISRWSQTAGTQGARGGDVHDICAQLHQGPRAPG